MADFINDLIGAMETLRTRLWPVGSGPDTRLYLNETEYAFFEAHEWIDFGIGTKLRNRRFTNAQCYADTGIPAQVEISIVGQIPR